MRMNTIKRYWNQQMNTKCSTLIEYCLENSYEPVWACRLENVGSYKLAEKLGFEMYGEVPYYRLSK